MRFLQKLGLVAAMAVATVAVQADYLAITFNNGIYRGNGAGQWSRLHLGAIDAFNAAAVSDTGRIYVARFNPTTLYQIDPETGVVSVPLALGADIRGMTWASGQLYGIRDGSPDRLVSINPNTGVVTDIGPTGRTALQNLGSIGSTLYSWDSTLGLMTINSVTGAAVDVNAGVGGIGGNVQSLEDDPDGRLILAGNTPNEWFDVDPATGIASPLPGSVPRDLRALVAIPRFERMIGYGTGNRHEIDSADKVFDRGPDGAAVGGAATSPDGWHYFSAGTQLFRRNPNNLLQFLVGNMGFQVRALTFRNGVLYGARNDIGAPDRIYTIDPSTGVPTFLGTSNVQDVVGMATQPGTNQLYAFDTTLGLCTMNAATGACVDVSGANPGNAQIQSLEFFESGVLRGAGTGFWNIIPTTGAVNLINGFPTGMGGLCLHAKTGPMYGIDFSGGNLFTVNMRTGAATLQSSGLPLNMNSMTTGEDGEIYTAVTGTIYRINTATNTASTVLATALNIRGLAAFGQDLYAVHDNALNDQLYRVNLRLGTVTLVGSMGGNFQSLEVSPYGTMYAYELTVGLCEVNPLTSVATDVNAGVGAVSTQALEFGLLDRLYGGQANLYTYNQPTGLSTLIGATGADLRGLAYRYRRASLSVTLQDFPFGDPATVVVEVQVRRPNTQEVLEVHFVQAGPGSSFDTEQNGVVDISVKGGHWLRRTQQVNLTSNFAISLINGDLDQNNVIDSDDFDIVVANFGGGPTGDLDGNNIVDSDDFDIIVKNFGDIGDD